MRVDNGNKVVELLEMYKDDMVELKSDRGTGFPVQEARRNIEIAYKEMFIKDLEKAINYKPKQSQKYYWRKKREYLAWFEEEVYLTRFKFSDNENYCYVLGSKNGSLKNTEQQARKILKDDFDKFEKVEIKESKQHEARV